jgi:hypothetical protein
MGNHFRRNTISKSRTPQTKFNHHKTLKSLQLSNGSYWKIFESDNNIYKNYIHRTLKWGFCYPVRNSFVFPSVIWKRLCSILGINVTVVTLHALTNSSFPRVAQIIFRVDWQHDTQTVTSSLLVFKTGMYLDAGQWGRITRQCHVPILHTIPTYSVHNYHNM